MKFKVDEAARHGERIREMLRASSRKARAEANSIPKQLEDKPRGLARWVQGYPIAVCLKVKEKPPSSGVLEG
jgi:hypothetical protein